MSLAYISVLPCQLFQVPFSPANPQLWLREVEYPLLACTLSLCLLASLGSSDDVSWALSDQSSPLL